MTTPLEVPTFRTRRSHSQLTAWETCPRQFWHYRIERHPEGASWWNVGGTAVHGTIESLNDPAIAGTVTPERAVGLFAYHFALGIEMAERDSGPKAGWRTANKGTEGELWWWTYGPEAVLKYHQWDADQAAVGSVVLASEQELLVDVEGVAFKGFIDQVRSADGGVRVIDFKNGRSKPRPVDQVAEYAWALERLWGIPVVEVSYLWLRPPVAKMPVSWTRPEWQAAYPWRRFVERVAAMDSAEKAAALKGKAGYVPRPGMPQCHSCAAWSQCNGIGRALRPGDKTL